MDDLFRSYSQNFEDVILWRALGSVQAGFYIDVGAAGPIDDSVSRGFYQQGWRGVHVEPNPDFATQLRADRPDETVIEALIGNDDDSSAPFHIFAGTGLSTGVAEIAESHIAEGRERTTLDVPTRTLHSILDEIGDREVHWMKIDVEGMESEVLASWNDSPVRPWILVVESTAPQTNIEVHEDWEGELLERGYQFVYFDGLNRFYVHEEHRDLAEHFGLGPNIFDRFTLTPKSAFVAVLLDDVRKAEANANAAHHAAAEQNRNFADTLAAALGWNERVSAAEAELQRTLTQLERVQTAFDELVESRRELMADLAEASDARHHAEVRALALEAEVAHLHEHTGMKEQRIEELLASTSWKVSAPVRALGGLRHRGTLPPEPPAEQAAEPTPVPTSNDGAWTLNVDEDTVASFNRLLAAAPDGTGLTDRD